jgi:hypothetical protein
LYLTASTSFLHRLALVLDRDSKKRILTPKENMAIPASKVNESSEGGADARTSKPKEEKLSYTQHHEKTQRRSPVQVLGNIIPRE